MLIKASFAEQLGLSWEQQNLEESATSCGSTAASKKLPRARLGQHLTLAYTGLRSQSHIQRKKSEGKNQTLMRRIHLVLFFSLFLLFFLYHSLLLFFIYIFFFLYFKCSTFSFIPLILLSLLITHCSFLTFYH